MDSQIRRIQCETIVKYFTPEQNPYGTDVRDEEGKLVIRKMENRCRGYAEWRVENKFLCTDCMIRFANEKIKQ